MEKLPEDDDSVNTVESDLLPSKNAQEDKSPYYHHLNEDLSNMDFHHKIQAYRDFSRYTPNKVEAYIKAAIRWVYYMNKELFKHETH